MAKYILKFFICALLLQNYSAHAILNDIFEVIDLSNVDLKNYEYFQNFPSQNPSTAAQANHFIEHFQKKKAVLDYFEHLFLGNSPFTHESEIPFNPHFGRSWRPYFERKYGNKGERLVEALGHGYSLDTLRRYGAIPKEFGSARYPS